MSLIYDKKTVAHIQSCLNSGQVSIKTIESYDTLLPGMRFSQGAATLMFSPCTMKGYDHPVLRPCYYLGERANREYMADWNLLPVGTHLVKDMRVQPYDKAGNVPYKVFTFTDIDGMEKYALVRHLFEIDDMDADDPDCKEYYDTYTDLLHQQQCFLIVKITTDKYSWGQREKLKIDSPTASIVINTPNITPIVPVEEQTQPQEDSIPLF